MLAQVINLRFASVGDILSYISAFFHILLIKSSELLMNTMKKYYIPILCLILALTAFFSLYSGVYSNVFTSIRKSTVIVIDVGHGGVDPGKVSTSGVEEKDVNLQIALYLKDYLIAQDYTVYLTRETDCGLYDENVKNKKTSDLNNRIRFFKEKNADLVVSIHQNSFPREDQHGAQTFYLTGSSQGKVFAEAVQNALLKFDDSNTRLAKSSDSYYLLKHSQVPAIIIECGFLSNPAETAKLTDSNYQKQLAYTISLGICSYAGNFPKEQPQT